MPGPQLRQAIPISKMIRESFPDIKVIWGGYFASNHSAVVLQSGFVDFVVNGPGDKCFPALLNSLETGAPYDLISNLVYRDGDRIVKTKKMNCMIRISCRHFLMKR